MRFSRPQYIYNCKKRNGNAALSTICYIFAFYCVPLSGHLSNGKKLYEIWDCYLIPVKLEFRWEKYCLRLCF